MSQLLFKHLAIGDHFSFVEADVRGERPIFIRKGRNKYASLSGGVFYTGICTPVVLVQAADQRRYTELEEVLLKTLRECAEVMDGPLAGLKSIEPARSATRRALNYADRHFPAPKPATNAMASPAPMHWTLPSR